MIEEARKVSFFGRFKALRYELRRVTERNARL